MALTCRGCGAEVSSQTRVCLRCGTPLAVAPSYPGFGFEWQSARTYGGYPLVHIAFGKDSRGKWRVAKDIVAIGQFGLGLVTVAQFGVGLLFGFGQFLIGSVVLAQIAGGLVLGVGRSPPVTWPSARWSWLLMAWGKSAWANSSGPFAEETAKPCNFSCPGGAI